MEKRADYLVPSRPASPFGGRWNRWVREGGERVLGLSPGTRSVLLFFLPPGILNFCANNYLGLSSHPEVIRAAVEALEKFGAGLSSVRFICGTQVPGTGAASPALG